MGRSYTKDADEVFREWCNICTARGDASNAYTVDGQRYFMELGRQQQDDSITGTVLRMISTDGTISSCVKCGTFKIAANGDVVRWPTKFRSMVAQ